LHTRHGNKVVTLHEGRAPLTTGGTTEAADRPTAPRQRIALSGNLAAAAWIVASTWVLGYGAHWTVLLNHIVVGAGIFVMVGTRFRRPLATGQLAVVVALLGVWLTASVFVLDYSDIADHRSLDWSDGASGAALVVFALWNTVQIGVHRGQDGFTSADRRG
jgi:hypothetical protein